MSLTYLQPADLRSALHAFAAVRGGQMLLEWVENETEERRDGGLAATFRLFVFAEDGAILNVKEQQLYLLGARQRADTPERLRALIGGWCQALEAVFTKLSAQGTETMEALLPYDLWFADVFSLSAPQTEAAFADRFLVKSRLGRYLQD